MAYLLKDNPSGISAREQVMFILVKDSESSIPSKGFKNLRFRAKLLGRSNSGAGASQALSSQQSSIPSEGLKAGATAELEQAKL